MVKCGVCKKCGVTISFDQEYCSICANDSDYGSDRLKEDFVDCESDEKDDWIDAHE